MPIWEPAPPRFGGVTAVLVLVSMCVRACAQGPGTMRVAVCVPGYSPFVQKHDDGGLVGHDIDLFKHVWKELRNMAAAIPLFREDGTHNEDGVRLRVLVGTSQPEYIEMDLSSLVASLANATIDVGMCGLYQTPEREALFDFLPPYLTTGLQAMVRKVLPNVSVLELLKLVLGTPDAYALFALEILVFCAVIYSHLLWLLEKDSNNHISGRYADGVWDSFWVAITTATTVGYGDKVAVTMGGKFLTLVWMFLGIFLVALFSAAITAGLLSTQTGLTHTGVQIINVGDMRGYKIGTSFPLATVALREVLPFPDLTVTQYPTEDASWTALDNGEIDVAVDDHWRAMYVYNKVSGSAIVPTGPIFFNEAACFGISRPGGMDHVIRKYMATAMVEHMRGQGRDQFEKTKNFWFGDLDRQAAADEADEAKVIQSALRDFNVPMLLLLVAMFGIWGLLVLISNWRRLRGAHRRFKMRVALGLKANYSSLELKQAAGEMHRRISRELLEEELSTPRPHVTDVMVVKYLSGLGQRISVKDVHKLQEQHRAESTEPFAKALGTALPADRIKSVGKKVASTVLSLKRSDSHHVYSRRPRAPPGEGVSDPDISERSVRANCPRGRVRSPDPQDAFQGVLRHNVSTDTPVTRGGTYDAQASPILRPVRACPPPTKTSPMMRPRDAESPISEKDRDAPRSIIVRSFRRRSMDNGPLPPRVVSEAHFAYICSFLILPKKMDMHQMTSHAPVLQHHIMDLRHDLERQLELLEQRVVGEVKLIPTALAEPSCLLADHFREWSEYTKRKRPRGGKSMSIDKNALQQLCTQIQKFTGIAPDVQGIDRAAFLESWEKARVQAASNPSSPALVLQPYPLPPARALSDEQHLVPPQAQIVRSLSGGVGNGWAPGGLLQSSWQQQGSGELAGLEVSISPAVGTPLRRRRSSQGLAAEAQLGDGDDSKLGGALAGKEQPAQPAGAHTPEPARHSTSQERPPLDRSGGAGSFRGKEPPSPPRCDSLRNSFGMGSRRGSRGSGDEVWDHVFVDVGKT